MNVGPTGRGDFDDRAVNALSVYERWMKRNSRSIYNCTMAEPEFITPDGCRLTQSADRKRIYVHLLEYPLSTLPLEGFAGRIKYAQFLHDASEIKFTESVINQMGDNISSEKSKVNLQIPGIRPDVVVPVIEIFLK